MIFEKNKDSLAKKDKNDVVSVLPKVRKQPKKKIFFKLIILVLLLAGACFGIYNLFFREKQAEIITAFTKYASVTTTISGSGTTVPKNIQSVTAASNAKILKVYVSAGDKVEAGDLLYEQDASAIDDAIEDYNDQIDDLEEEIDDYEKMIDDYEEQLKEANENLSNLIIYAPISGHLSAVGAQNGDDVQNGTRLAVINDDSRMKLTQYFSYAYEDKVYIGMKASVSIASQMSVAEGTVEAIDKVEYMTRTGAKCFAVTIAVDNPGSYTEGLSASGYLITEDGEKIYPSKEGCFEHYETKTIKAEVSGTITAYALSEYGYVEKGQLLAEIDSDTYQNQITTLEKQIKRYNGYIENNRNKIETIKEAIEETEEKREDYYVRAEISGTIISCNVEEGSKPSTMLPAVVLYNLDVMEISVNIDELDVDYLAQGMEVQVVRSTASGSQTYTGIITELSLEGTASNGVSYFPAVIEIESEGKLSAGVSVSYYIYIGEADDGVLAPISALRQTSEGICLFVKSDTRPDDAIDIEGVEVPNGFYAVPVETGTSDSQYVRIEGGVSENTEVFVGYKQSAPSGGDSTSKSQTSSSGQDFGSFDGMNGSFGGGMPGGNMQGGMSGGNMGGRNMSNR